MLDLASLLVAATLASAHHGSTTLTYSQAREAGRIDAEYLMVGFTEHKPRTSLYNFRRIGPHTITMRIKVIGDRAAVSYTAKIKRREDVFAVYDSRLRLLR